VRGSEGEEVGIKPQKRRRVRVRVRVRDALFLTRFVLPRPLPWPGGLSSCSSEWASLLWSSPCGCGAGVWCEWVCGGLVGLEGRRGSGEVLILEVERWVHLGSPPPLCVSRPRDGGKSLVHVLAFLIHLGSPAG